MSPSCVPRRRHHRAGRQHLVWARGAGHAVTRSAAYRLATRCAGRGGEHEEDDGHRGGVGGRLCRTSTFGPALRDRAMAKCQEISNVPPGKVSSIRSGRTSFYLQRGDDDDVGRRRLVGGAGRAAEAANNSRRCMRDRRSDGRANRTGPGDGYDRAVPARGRVGPHRGRSGSAEAAAPAHRSAGAVAEADRVGVGNA